MSTAKIAIVLAAIATITLAILGIAAASQIAQNQIYSSTQAAPNNVAPNQGFWGWLGNCFGFWANQTPNNQYIVPPVSATNTTAPAPYQPYQGGYGYGYGPCWAGW